MLDSGLKDIVILFGLGLLTVISLGRFRFPSIVGFLLAGTIAGPNVLGLIGNAHHVEQMAEVGVVLLLFTIGIEFSLKELMNIRHLVLLGGGLQMFLTVAAVTAVGAAFGFTIAESVFFGSLAALSSTAIVMKLLMDSGQMDTPHGKTSLGILIFQDLCVVPLMLFVPLLGEGGNGLLQISLISLKAAAVVFAAHYGARFLIPWIFRLVVGSRSRELFILTIIFIGMGTAWLTSLAGLSLAFGAFIAGLAISESEYSHQALGDIMPFREAFMSLFFISVGMLLDPAILLDHPLLILCLTASIMLVKALIGAGACLALGLPLRVGIMVGLALAQIGEFSFVLSQSGLKHGLLSDTGYQVFLAASIITMGLSPLALKAADPLAHYLTGRLPRPWVHGRGILSGKTRKTLFSDHVIIVGYGINGRNLAKVLKHLKIPYVIIETNPFTVSAEKKRGEHVVFGDASQPEVMEHAQVSRARILVVAISDAAASRRISAQARKMNPQVHVIVRTRHILEVEPLFKLGVNEVIPEEFETSVEILSRVLRKFLVSQDLIEACVSGIRDEGYEMLRSVSRRHSHAVGISGFLSGAEIGTFTVQKGAAVEGTSLREGVMKSRSGATILAIKRGEEMVTNPDPVWEMLRGDVVLVLGSREQLKAAARLFENPTAKPTGRRGRERT